MTGRQRTAVVIPAALLGLAALTWSTRGDDPAPAPNMADAREEVEIARAEQAAAQADVRAAEVRVSVAARLKRHTEALVQGGQVTEQLRAEKEIELARAEAELAHAQANALRARIALDRASRRLQTRGLPGPEAPPSAPGADPR